MACCDDQKRRDEQEEEGIPICPKEFHGWNQIDLSLQRIEAVRPPTTTALRSSMGSRSQGKDKSRRARRAEGGQLSKKVISLTAWVIQGSSWVTQDGFVNSQGAAGVSRESSYWEELTFRRHVRK